MQPFIIRSIVLKHSENSISDSFARNVSAGVSATLKQTTTPKNRAFNIYHSFIQSSFLKPMDFNYVATEVRDRTGLNHILMGEKRTILLLFVHFIFYF